MEELHRLVEFVTTIAKITRTVNIAYEAYNKFPEDKFLVGSLNGSREKEGLIHTEATKKKKEDEEPFLNLTCMNDANLNLLLSLLEERLERFSRRKAVRPKKRLAVTLMYLSQGCDVKVISLAFNLGISTVRKVIYETCDAIWSGLRAKYVSPPNLSKQKEISNEFYVKTGMPNCLGAVDGKHIHINCPSKSGTLHYHCKKSFSMVLMAACDANYVFTHADVQQVGSPTDSSAISQSEFGSKLLSEKLKVPSGVDLPGTATYFPFYYVGSNALPLKKNIMRAFPGRNLPEDKIKFNEMLSKTRMYIENTFGVLVSRWRVLHTKINASPTNAAKIVLATVALHNFLMLQKDRNYFTIEFVDHFINNQEVQGDWRNEIIPLESYQPRSANRSSATAFELREVLRDFFSK